jgi:hypothetical protein
MGLAALALTVGMAVGEAQFSNAPDGPIMPVKLNRDMQVSTFDFMESNKLGARRLPYHISTLTGKDSNPLEAEEPAKEGVKAVCFWEDQFEEGETAIYSAEVAEVKMSEVIVGGEELRVEIYVKNTGNTFWFGMDSGCTDKTIVNLGTAKPIDRASVFYNEGENTGWAGNNRVEMVENVVRPGDIATFAFTAVAPDMNSIYREYFNLVAENVAWLEGGEVAVDIRVGSVTEEDEAELTFLLDSSADTAGLTGEYTIEIDLSDQKMFLKIGGTVVYTMPISSGAASTPTPTGTYSILSKQELRVGGKSPYYRMPYFQMFDSRGYGLHALPYLGSTGGGYFWEEALSHIGIPVSHGCVRMLPDDAVTVYQFTEIGTQITIYK